MVSGKSDQLNAYNVYLGTLGISSRICRDIALPMGQVWKLAAARWLSTGHVALSVVPRGRAALALEGSLPVSVS